MQRVSLNISLLTPYVFISGSYESNKSNDFVCRLIGQEFTKHNLGVISAGSIPGKNVINSIDKTLSDRDEYHPMKMLTFYRKKHCHEILAPRVGCKIFVGKTVEEMRRAAFHTSKAMVIIGGGVRTKDEIILARTLKIPVIPIGMSGGAAGVMWDQQLSNSTNHPSFLQLNNKKPQIVVEAVITILKVHLDLRD